MNAGHALSGSGLTALDATDKLSVVFWLLGGLNGQPVDLHVIRHWDSVTSLKGYRLGGRTSGSPLGAGVQLADDSSFASASFNVPDMLRVGQIGFVRTSDNPWWSHIGMVFNGIEVLWYLNGLLCQRVAVTKTMTVGGTRATVIGGGNFAAQLLALSDIRVFTAEALGPAQIRAAMAGRRVGGEAGWWGIGRDAVNGMDRSGRGNHLTWDGSGTQKGTWPEPPHLRDGGYAIGEGLTLGPTSLRRRVDLRRALAGLALVAVRTESTELSEARIRLLGIRRLRSESLELAEGRIPTLGIVRLRNEVLEAGEAVLRLLGITRLRGETLELPETRLGRLGMTRLRAESLELPEARLAVRGLTRLRSETAELPEVRVSVRGLARLRSETLELAETLVTVLGRVRVRSETAELGEGRLRFLGIRRLRAEALELPESRIRILGIVRHRGESTQLAEGTLRWLGIVRGRNETADIAEAAVRRLGILRVRGEVVELAEGVRGIRGLVVIRGETLQLVEGRIGILAAAFLGAFSALIQLVPLFGTLAQVEPLYAASPEAESLYRTTADLEPEGEG